MPGYISIKKNKADACELSVSNYLSMLRTKRNWLASEHRLILVGYLKLFRFMSVMMVQTKLPQTVPYPEQRNWKKKYHEGTTKLEN